MANFRERIEYTIDTRKVQSYQSVNPQDGDVVLNVVLTDRSKRNESKTSNLSLWGISNI